MSKSSKSYKNTKLKSYITIALSAIAAEASSQVIYTDIKDSTLINNGDFFDIDLNNDGINDLKISKSVTSLRTGLGGGSYLIRFNDSANARALGSNRVKAIHTINNRLPDYAVPFSSSYSINAPRHSWLPEGLLGSFEYEKFYGQYSSLIRRKNLGLFPGQGDKFVGLKFKIGTNTHYGWIRLDVVGFTNYVTIKDFAFDTTANAPILAGDTGVAVGINKLNVNGINLYAQQNRLYFQDAIEQTAEIRIYDLKGQLIERRRALPSQAEMQLSKQYQGIYIIEVNQGEHVFRKKLWLESN